MADEQAPTSRQAAVIDAVCGLANALLASWGRGSGETWVRARIAERVIADDHLEDEAERARAHLAAVYGGTGSRG